MLNNLYAKMKNGDLFTCIIALNPWFVKVCPWVEKSQISRFKPHRYIRDRSKIPLHEGIKLKLMQKAGE